MCFNLEQRLSFMNEINYVYGTEHTVDRANLYDDVLKLYQEGNIATECPIYIHFKGRLL